MISEKQSKAHKRGLPLENHSSVMAVDRISSREERKKKTAQEKKDSEQESQSEKSRATVPQPPKATGLHKNKTKMQKDLLLVQRSLKCCITSNIKYLIQSVTFIFFIKAG